MLFFSRKTSIEASGLLVGGVDNHSHVLYGVDDGVKTPEESLRILSFLEKAGLRELWCTPHIMEDVPNTTEKLTVRFEELKSLYNGPVILHLAAEYMMDTLYPERLHAGDLLLHGGMTVLVETSTMAPPIDLWGTLSDTQLCGYTPILAHPERYMYMKKQDYSRLINMGVRLQLNYPSVLGFYGSEVQSRALFILEKGWYSMVGSDCHREKNIQSQYSDKALKPSVAEKLRPLMGGTLFA